MTKRLFENKSVMKNNKSFWVLPFFKKTVSFRSFCKKLHQKRPLILKHCHELTFQAVPEEVLGAALFQEASKERRLFDRRQRPEIFIISSTDCLETIF
ncbi:hypothetical protein [Komagataeibacter swingsii]|uniref:Uncharacterized protein n=1 Tax=Komagataeibacter swingsii TaxID=215220 RepID=A0A850P8E4_9PROT|nr:hypothetical protein [Komagataeibacter swingsii]NVN38576.1 hypothetical protein [Komagataeibacter swingsii]